MTMIFFNNSNRDTDWHKRRLEQKIDLILDRLDIDDQETPLEKRLKFLLNSNQKIQALREFKEQTGVGLKEAKDAVEAIERGRRNLERKIDLILKHFGIEYEENLLEKRLKYLLSLGQKIQALKEFRAQTGAGLKEAKDAVEAIEKDMHNSIRQATSQSDFV